MEADIRNKELPLKEFENYLTDQNRSKHTIRSYLYAVSQFFQRYSEITISNLQSYKLYLFEHYKPRTINLRINGMNRFLTYVGWTDGLVSLIKIQRPVYLEHVISEGDYEYLKIRLLADKKYFYYFLIRLMAATGARVSEVVQFTVADIQIGFKNIYSKGNKVHRIYIPRLLRKDMTKWLKETKRLSGDIFITSRGKRISDSGIRKQLKNMALCYHLDERVMYPHSFRHRFAKNFVRYCDNISLLSDLLGHGSLEATRIYLRRSSLEQKEIVNQVVDW